MLTQWRCLQCPLKVAGNDAELQWSKALESVRKDVECFFGILKGRFRILKLPLQYREHVNIDDMFMSCCILHNIIHAWDNRSEWECDVDWQGEYGRLDVQFAEPGDDFSAIGARSFKRTIVADTIEEAETGYYALRRDLIQHYQYAKQAGEVRWLRSSRTDI